MGHKLPDGERRLAAIMYTDIVGYTSLSQKSESLAMQLLEMHRGIVRPFFTKHNGREVKTIGDAFLVEFTSALEAVRCAFDIQQSMHEMNLGRSPEKLIQLRIGIHVGDVIHRQNDVYGDAVNIASRIVPLAMPGGVCVSRQVYDQIRNKFEFPLASLGVKELKNVAGPIEAFRVVTPWEGSDYSQPGLAANRLAVLPFVNMSPDPQDAFLADGITEEIISTTSRIQDLNVISRTTVMRYKQTTKSTTEIGRELSAGKLLEGSVRRSGNRLRIAVQLLDAEKDQHIWAENYDRELQDIFAVQSDVANNVASHLSKGITKAVEGKDTDDIEAYSLYIRAMQLSHESTETSLGEAAGLYEEAVARDSHFSRAYAGLARALFYLGSMGHEEWVTILQKMEAAARKAVELGPGRAESHVALAYFCTAADRYQDCIYEAQEAIRINPNLSEAHSVLGNTLASQGRLDEALVSLRRAYELDPLLFDAGLMLGSVALIAGRDDEALEVLTRMREFFPANPRVFGALAGFYRSRNDFTRALEMNDQGQRLAPGDLWLKQQQGVLYALTGRREEATRQLEELSREGSRMMQLTAQLFINTALGNIDEAFNALMKAAESHAWYWLIKTDPPFEPLRKDPRFAEFCKKVGLPP